jgi:hypothetical protein
MKPWLFVMPVSLAICILLGCSGTGNNNEKQKKRKSEIEEAIDYGTGKTQITAGQRTKAKLIQASIDNAVRSYAVMEGRKPTSLQELVDAGLLNKKYTKDEWGRELIVTPTAHNKIAVRSMGADRKPNTSDDWVKEY